MRNDNTIGAHLKELFYDPYLGLCPIWFPYGSTHVVFAVGGTATQDDVFPRRNPAYAISYFEIPLSDQR